MPTVVLVGRDREVLDVIAGMLAERGITVLAADDPLEAITHAVSSEEPPDLILIERELARAAEAKLLESLRSASRLDGVPIVLFTAHGAGSADAPPVERLRDALDVELLLAIVHTVCARSLEEPDDGEHKADAQPTPVDL